ncbi:uncharacterized protein [Watersipora subatra]|uniref:uncharacterized protein isoform X1 n=1 Tax=Watersipora subatra TaxID=2589382 RepID=UPI00355AFFB7
MAMIFSWRFFLKSLLLLFIDNISAFESTPNQILYMDTEGIDCGNEIFLGTATVYSHMNAEAGDYYSHSQECSITFMAKDDGWRLLIKFDYIDIPDYLYNGVCTDSLYIYDSPDLSVRPFKYAGGNNGVCGKTLPPVLVSTGQFISVYFRTDASGQVGKGFKFQVTAFTDVEAGECPQGLFYCTANDRCIDSLLVCDGIEQCSEGEDEEDNGDSMCNPSGGLWSLVISLGVAGFVGVLVGGLVVIILLIVCVVCTYRRCGKTPGEGEHRQSIQTSNHGSIPQQHLAKDRGAYQQVVQSPPVDSYNMPNTLNNPAMHCGQGPTCCPANSMPQPHIPHQHRPSYVAQQSAMEMQAPLVPLQRHNSGGGHPQPPATGPAGAYNYNFPYHVARGAESHSYSSGYSSQQGPANSGFQPMHTKPIIAQRGYTPTSSSSRSSRSQSESSRGARGDNHRYRRGGDIGRQRHQEVGS